MGWSSIFGALVFSLRHFYFMPASSYEIVLTILLIGFFPSIFIYYYFNRSVSPYIIVCNALFIVSGGYYLMDEHALGPRNWKNHDWNSLFIPWRNDW
jgi:hypothetical protein